MGLATIDPLSHLVQTTLYKITMFSINRPKTDTAICKCQNLQRNVWPSGRCPNTVSGLPYISFFLYGMGLPLGELYPT